MGRERKGGIEREGPGRSDSCEGWEREMTSHPGAVLPEPQAEPGAVSALCEHEPSRVTSRSSHEARSHGIGAVSGAWGGAW